MNAGLRLYSVVLLIAGALATAMILVSMFTFPIPYLWHEHYLSAMGMTVLPNQTPNNLTYLLFNAALVLAGVLGAGYFLLRGRAMRPPAAGYAVLAAGLIGGIGLAAIGLTPYNLAPDIHNLSTYLASAGFALAMLLCLFERDSVFGSRENNVTWALMTLLIGLIWYGLEWLCRHRLIGGTPCGQFQQKMIVLFFWLFMMRHAFTLFFNTKK